MEVNTCKIRESVLKRMVHDIRKRMKLIRRHIVTVTMDTDGIVKCFDVFED